MFPKYLIPVGSKARNEKITNDHDFITTKNLYSVYTDLSNKGNVKFIRGSKRFMKIIYNNYELDIWYVTKEEKPYVKLMRTLNKEDAITLYSIARHKNIRIKPNGLFKNGRKIYIHNPTPKNIIKKISKSYQIPYYLVY